MLILASTKLFAWGPCCSQVARPRHFRLLHNVDLTTEKHPRCTLRSLFTGDLKRMPLMYTSAFPRKSFCTAESMLHLPLWLSFRCPLQIRCGTFWIPHGAIRPRCSKMFGRLKKHPPFKKSNCKKSISCGMLNVTPNAISVAGKFGRPQMC